MADKPDFESETQLMSSGALRVAGVDEVGRGPLAGPVVAAAVRLDPTSIPMGLNDSKKLTAKRRLELNHEIMASADWAIGIASVEEIDQINILQAIHLAMVRAVGKLSVTPDHVLVDGNRLPRDLRIPATTMVKGDARSVSIAAASIIAKVHRDQIMVDLAQQFPGYGWEKNSGYPTSVHLESLQNIGVTPHHRRSFRPVHNILYQAKSITN
jgi:ribonuclease HII